MCGFQNRKDSQEGKTRRVKLSDYRMKNCISWRARSRNRDLVMPNTCLLGVYRIWLISDDNHSVISCFNYDTQFIEKNLLTL